MSQCVFNTKIQFRRDTTANWLANPEMVPAAGEPCVDLDTGDLRIGNGINRYCDLKIYTSYQNIIEKIKVSGIDLPIAADHSVEIPIASNEQHGVVIGSKVENKVFIAEDGTMEIYSLSLDRLAQTHDDSVVFGGGGAAG